MKLRWLARKCVSARSRWATRKWGIAARSATPGALLLDSPRTAAPRQRLLVVAILTASTSADDANSAKRIELYGVLEIRIVVHGLTKLGRCLRRRRLEIVWISHIGSQAFSNQFPIYGVAVIAEVFRLE